MAEIDAGAAVTHDLAAPAPEVAVAWAGREPYALSVVQRMVGEGLGLVPAAGVALAGLDGFFEGLVGAVKSRFGWSWCGRGCCGGWIRLRRGRRRGGWCGCMWRST